MDKSFRNFTIKADGYFLKQDVTARYSLDYTKRGNPGNPNFICNFKDEFSRHSFNSPLVQEGCKESYPYVYEFLQYFTRKVENSFIVCVVPRSKPHKSQHFKDFIKSVIMEIRGKYPNKIFDGSEYIQRIKETKTTHFMHTQSEKLREENRGSDPYPGITKDTCAIFEEGIRGKNVLLIDDIYTHHHRNPQTGEKEIVGVDEDCLQALLDCGAKKVVFYALAKTIK